MSKSHLLFFAFILLVLLAALAWSPHPALADGQTCNWTAGSGIDYYWSNGDNWACSGGSGPPSGQDDVFISSGYANAPMVIGNEAAKSLTLTAGVLKIGAGASLTVDTLWINIGEATIESQGALYGNGEVTHTGTFHFLDSGTIYGNLQIDPLATASVAVVYLHGNVMNNGTLTGEDVDAQFHMLGQLFTNYGSVSTNEFYFERGGVQQVTGNGSWDGGIDYLFVSSGTHLTATSNLTFNPQNFSIGGSGDLLDVGSFQVTFQGPGEVGDAGSIVGSAGGSVHTQGDGLTIYIPNEGYFNPPLVVEDGVTYASGLFSGPVTVGLEGTLRVNTSPVALVKAASDVTVDGVVDSVDESGGFEWLGTHMTVNGAITVAELDLNGVSRQDITGTGSLDLDDLNVNSPDGVNLGVPLTLDGTLSLNGNLYATGETVTLAESAILNGENSDKDIFGTVRRNGPFVQDKSYSFGNRHLVVTFTNSGSALPTSVTMQVRQAPWVGLPGSIQRSYSIQSTGGSGWAADLKLDYRDSELHGLEETLQSWARSSFSVPWARLTYTEANFNQNWIEFDHLTHFSDWGLVIHAVFVPLVSR